MTLATKNNAIIVKDGKLAENCGCCGGWYCYDERGPCCRCGFDSQQTISVSITDPQFSQALGYVDDGSSYANGLFLGNQFIPFGALTFKVSDYGVDYGGPNCFSGEY